MSTSRTVASILAAGALTAGLAACTTQDANTVATPTATSEETTTADTTTDDTEEPTTETSEDTTATNEEEVTLSVDPATNLTEGDEITLEVTGLDPELAYRAAICSPDEGRDINPIPRCTGDETDPDAQAQLSNSAIGEAYDIPDNGTVTVTLTAHATGDGINCTEQECVARIFGDHTDGFRHVTEVPVTFAAQ